VSSVDDNVTNSVTGAPALIVYETLKVVPAGRLGPKLNNLIVTFSVDVNAHPLTGLVMLITERSCACAKTDNSTATKSVAICFIEYELLKFRKVFWFLGFDEHAHGLTPGGDCGQAA
jgi:hypothetical protein